LVSGFFELCAHVLFVTRVKHISNLDSGQVQQNLKYMLLFMKQRCVVGDVGVTYICSCGFALLKIWSMLLSLAHPRYSQRCTLESSSSATCGLLHNNQSWTYGTIDFRKAKVHMCQASRSKRLTFLDAGVASNHLLTLRAILQGVLGAMGFQLTKKQPFPVLKDVSGVIKPGRMTLLLGPPGCGKTTLLTALSGRLKGSVVMHNLVHLERLFWALPLLAACLEKIFSSSLLCCSLPALNVRYLQDQFPHMYGSLEPYTFLWSSFTFCRKFTRFSGTSHVSLESHPFL
jgi:hypothetical protein